jgi:hypothetical protein
MFKGTVARKERWQRRKVGLSYRPVNPSTQKAEVSLGYIVGICLKTKKKRKKEEKRRKEGKEGGRETKRKKREKERKRKTKEGRKIWNSMGIMMTRAQLKKRK